MWSLLGPRPVDVFGWESFGQGWITDITKQLKLPEVRTLTADYGQLPDMTQANPEHDTVFTWNGTTSGAKLPNGDWIADERTPMMLRRFVASTSRRRTWKRLVSRLVANGAVHH